MSISRFIFRIISVPSAKIRAIRDLMAFTNIRVFRNIRNVRVMRDIRVILEFSQTMYRLYASSMSASRFFFRIISVPSASTWMVPQ
jgi:hypothetical protein